MGYSIVEWDGVGSHNDYELVTGMLHVLYVISYGGVNIGEGKELFGVELVMTIGMIW